MKPTHLKYVGNIFVIAGLLALGYWTFEFVRARLYQARESSRFVSERKPEAPQADTTPSKSPTTAERSYPSKGSAIATLVIPRLDLSVIVVEGAKERELKLGPGHIPGTALPGEGGNVGVAGHRDTFFRPLRLIRKNDAIKVITHEKEYQYRVVSTAIVEPRDIHVLFPTERETLTLVTCYPFDFVGAAPKRFIVRADCVDCTPQS